jgi:HAMP domain-containing protein
MTEGLIEEGRTQLSKEERFLRIALIVISVIMIALDVFMFVYNVWPNNILMLIMMVPIVISVVFAWQGKPTQAVWLFSVSTWIGMIAEAALAPQSPLDLVGIRQYLFPLMLVGFVGIFGLEKGKARTSNIIGSFVATLISALIGYYADKSEVGAISSEMVWIVNVLVILAALGLIYLVIINFQRGLSLFRSSIGLKTGAGFFVSALIIVGFIIFTINSEIKITKFYDSFRYPDAQKFLTSRVYLEIQGLRLDQTEYFTNIGELRTDEEYMAYSVEYQNHYDSLQLLFEELDILQQEGLGTYLPGKNDDLVNTASLKKVLEYVDSKSLEIISLVDERGYENKGLEGELRRARFAVANLAVSRDFPELEVLLLKMRQSEMAWTAKHDWVDAEAVNTFGADAISMLKDLEILTSERNVAEQAINTYLNKFNQVVELDKQISGVNTEISTAIDPLLPELEDLVAVSKSRSEEAQRMMGESIVSTRITSVALSVSAIFLIAIIGYLTNRSIVRPIIQLTETTTEFAEGNLEIRAAITSEDETGRLAGVFNQISDRSQALLANLEQTIAERTTELQERAREMEASQRVTFAASERTTPEDFLDLLVNLIADQFDIYHCQVYLVDEEKNAAVLSQSTGYAGRQLLQRGHSIPLDAQSLVTQCINTGEAVLVAETAADPNWLPNVSIPVKRCWWLRPQVTRTGFLTHCSRSPNLSW